MYDLAEYVTVIGMKTLSFTLLLIGMLVALPWLHGTLVSLVDAGLFDNPLLRSFFYPFTIPAWTLSIVVFAVETYRRGWVPSSLKITNTLLLALMGLLAPTIAIVLSPAGLKPGLTGLSIIAAVGFMIGWVAAVVFNNVVALINRKHDGQI